MDASQVRSLILISWAHFTAEGAENAEGADFKRLKKIKERETKGNKGGQAFLIVVVGGTFHR